MSKSAKFYKPNILKSLAQIAKTARYQTGSARSLYRGKKKANDTSV